MNYHTLNKLFQEELGTSLHLAEVLSFVQERIEHLDLDIPELLAVESLENRNLYNVFGTDMLTDIPTQVHMDCVLQEWSWDDVLTYLLNCTEDELQGALDAINDY